ncbi:hypothetical protein PPL_06898 [Heterostelium album PN500]|uniref:Cullin N-terminal domain-containing protein n=1 Tax=Heterostelium pallidum (strain ATCC 26659 / Pp 5 / PN500) TaxID=670386 RepID=D3BDU5_HETP5|nr:hypothetical protein PPL_06898 [Heterostelium album PN500]EFA80076.1 hypothetical protein PPL_06898 [Heterostelium album PN500]|eukprot:XP_020432196.1 hypothetical protein PPL_06898 [Heterostelium album PN500]
MTDFENQRILCLESVRLVLDNSNITPKEYMPDLPETLYEEIKSTIENYLFMARSEQFNTSVSYTNEELFDSFKSLWSNFKKSVRLLSNILEPLSRVDPYVKQNIISLGFTHFKSIIIESTSIASIVLIDQNKEM